MCIRDRGTTPTFLRHIVRAAYCWPFDKVWLSSACWYPSAKPGNEGECGIYIGWVKMQVEFDAVCGAEFMTFWRDVGDISLFSTHLTECLYRVSFRRCRPLKLPLSCEVAQKGSFGAPICRWRRYHRFRTCVFKLHLLPTMWPIFVELRSATSKIRRRKERKKERMNEWKKERKKKHW